MFALVLALASAPFAYAQNTDVAGWWRADIEQGGEVEPFYFHFDHDEANAPRARFTIPVARMVEVAGGPYQVEGRTLSLPNFGLSFALNADANAFDGVLPPSFVSGTETPVHFVRASEPPAPAALAPPQGAAPAPLWTVSVGSQIWAGLVLDRERALFVAGDDGRVTALTPRNGARLWQVELGASIRATPTLRGRRLYVATDQALFALDARNGRQIWSAQFGAERSPRLPITNPDSKWDHYSSAAVVDDELAVVGSRDGCVYALNVRTGAQIWRTCTEALVTSTPALTRDAVYFGGYDHNAYALSRADGHELWRFDTHDAIPRDVLIVGENVLFGSRSYDIFALNAHTGAQAWTRHVWYSWIDAPPLLADGRVYTGTSDAAAVFAFDPNSGVQIWKTPVPGWTWGGLALGRDALYTGVTGAAYATPRLGGFAAMNRSDGAMRWMLTAEPFEDRHEIYGFAAAPAVSGARVFAADLAGTVYAFEDEQR